MTTRGLGTYGPRIFLVASLVLWGMGVTVPGAVVPVLAGDGAGIGEEAQESPVPVLSLREALVAALSENHSLRASQARTEAARETAAEARSYLLPQVRFEERYLRTDNPAYVFSTKINQGLFRPEDLAGAPGTFNHPETLDDFETSLSLEQPVFAPVVLAGKRAADAGARAAGFMHERARQETAFRVLEAFENLKAAKAFSMAAEAAQADAEEHLRIARQRRDVGIGLDSDVLQLEAALGMARSGFIRAENGLRLAKRGLGLLVGAAGPVDIREDEPVDLPRHTDPALLLSRPDLAAMEEQVNQAASAVRMAEGSFYPSLGVFAAGQWNDPDNPFGDSGDSFRAGAVLRWDLFSGFGDRARRARALKELEAARQAEQGLIASARFGVEEAQLRLEEASATMAVAGQSLKAAEEGARLVGLRFENGLAPVVSLISAQAGLDAARAEQIRAKAHYAIALGAVHFQGGTLLDHLLPGPSEGSAAEMPDGRPGEPEEASDDLPSTR